MAVWFPVPSFNVLLRDGKLTDEAIPVLSEARYKSRFLFGKDITEHIDEVWDKFFQMRKLHEELYGKNGLPVGHERNLVCENESSLLKWNLDQQETSPQRFARYLRFE